MLILCKLLQPYSNNKNGHVLAKSTCYTAFFLEDIFFYTGFIAACQSTSPLLQSHALHFISFLKCGSVVLFRSFSCTLFFMPAGGNIIKFESYYGKVKLIV